MLEEHKFYIKTAVDIDRRILVGGGELHYDCEQVLLEAGSFQENIWCASFMPAEHKITYNSIVNLRPRQNSSLEILDPQIRDMVAQIVIEFLGNL